MDGEGPEPYQGENPAVVGLEVVALQEALTSKYGVQHPVDCGPFGCRAPAEC